MMIFQNSRGATTMIFRRGLPEGDRVHFMRHADGDDAAQKVSCATGNWHIKYTNEVRAVTCRACLNTLTRRDYIASLVTPEMEKLWRQTTEKTAFVADMTGLSVDHRDFDGILRRVETYYHDAIADEIREALKRDPEFFRRAGLQRVAVRSGRYPWDRPANGE